MVYKPPSLNNQYFCDFLPELLDLYSSIYDNKVVFVDFNLEISHPVMLLFMNNENFINLVKGNACFNPIQDELFRGCSSFEFC